MSKDIPTREEYRRMAKKDVDEYDTATVYEQVSEVADKAFKLGKLHVNVHNHTDDYNTKKRSELIAAKFVQIETLSKEILRSLESS